MRFFNRVRSAISRSRRLYATGWLVQKHRQHLRGAFKLSSISGVVSRLLCRWLFARRYGPAPVGSGTPTGMKR